MKKLLADLRQRNVFRVAGVYAIAVEYWRESGNWGDYCRPVGADDFECS